MLLPSLIALVIGYLLGSLPFGYLVARAKGVNIFEVGSRNPGATNVRRVLGAGPGNLVFLLDALKGAAAAAWALIAIFGNGTSYDFSDLGFASVGRVEGSTFTQMGVAGLVGALLGHSFSCFTKFRGGKGVATSVGGLLILMPLAIVIAASTWAVVFYLSRYVSLSSLAAAVVLVVAAYALHLPPLLLGLAALVSAFVILRHLTNIKRLLNGTENKFVRKTVAPKS
ncbi:MAG: glycerol-3-phosphate 1-O-acyltransferase PlsY [Opitutus sp.]